MGGSALRSPRERSPAGAAPAGRPAEKGGEQGAPAAASGGHGARRGHYLSEHFAAAVTLPRRGVGNNPGHLGCGVAVLVRRLLCLLPARLAAGRSARRRLAALGTAAARWVGDSPQELHHRTPPAPSCLSSSVPLHPPYPSHPLCSQRRAAPRLSLYAGWRLRPNAEGRSRPDSAPPARPGPARPRPGRPGGELCGTGLTCSALPCPAAWRGRAERRDEQALVPRQRGKLPWPLPFRVGARQRELQRERCFPRPRIAGQLGLVTDGPSCRSSPVTRACCCTSGRGVCPACAKAAPAQQRQTGPAWS